MKKHHAHTHKSAGIDEGKRNGYEICKWLQKTNCAPKDCHKSICSIKIISAYIIFLTIFYHATRQSKRQLLLVWVQFNASTRKRLCFAACSILKFIRLANRCLLIRLHNARCRCQSLPFIITNERKTPKQTTFFRSTHTRFCLFCDSFVLIAVFSLRWIHSGSGHMSTHIVTCRQDTQRDFSEAMPTRIEPIVQYPNAFGFVVVFH